jgi:flagellar hook-associated protein 1
MSSLGSVLNTALTSMSANQLALSVASNNIANAGNADFSRQRLLTTPAGSDGSVPAIGLGVDVVGVDAVRDALINSRLRQETSAKAGADTLTGGLSNVEALFNDGNSTGLLQSITNFFNSFQTLAQDPASLSFREQLKVSAGALIDALHARNSDLTTIKTNADKAVSADVDQINQLSRQIADLTKQIKLEAVSDPANNLRDRRAALVRQLSSYVEVHELDSGGDYELTTKDNHPLVFNGTAQTLNSSDVTTNIGDGSLKAEVDLRDTYVPKYLGALDQLAYEITQHVNSIHSSAYDLNGTTGNNFFAPLSSASGASGTIDLSSDVANDTKKIAASSLSTGNDNTAATQIANLLHSAVFTGGSVTDQYGSIVFNVGTDAAAAQSGVNEHQALLTQLQNQQQSISGVSVDEETVQILQFQRSFQASARLIQAVDQMLQVALGLGS